MNATRLNVAFWAILIISNLYYLHGKETLAWFYLALSLAVMASDYYNARRNS